MSEQLISQLCMTFDSMNTNDNKVRQQAEGYLKQVLTNPISYNEFNNKICFRSRALMVPFRAYFTFPQIHKR